MADAPLPSVSAPPIATPTVPSAPVDLRPLTTSELIDRGFSLYRAHFTGLLLLGLLCQSAPLLGQILTTSLQLNPTKDDLLVNPTLFFQKTGLIGIIAFVGQIVVFCFEVAITFYIADAYLGKVPSVKESFRKFGARIGSSLWTCLLNRIIIVLTFLFPIAVAGAASLYIHLLTPETMTALIVFCIVAGLSLIASFAPVLIVLMRLMITIPALALEDYSGWKAIKRSASLVRYDPGLGFLYWGEMRLSFLLLPPFIIELMILLLAWVPLSIHHIGEIFRHGSSGAPTDPPDSIMIISQIVVFLAGSVIVPLYSIATVLFYYDIRIRREGFDLEFMAGQLKGRK